MSQDPHTRPYCGLWIWLGRSRASAAPTDETVGLGTTGLGNCFVATCAVSAKFFRHGSGGNWTALPPWRLLGPAAAARSPQECTPPGFSARPRSPTSS